MESVESQELVVDRLSKEIRAAAKTLTPDEMRYLVDYYYQIQGDRIRAGNQISVASKSGEPHPAIVWVGGYVGKLEKRILSLLDEASDASELGKWAKSQVDVGPVIAAGLLAHIDITKAPTAGHIWSFAGLNPTASWSKGEKRPWNARLKTLCWKIGESFTITKGKEESFYGKVYAERKLYEIENNEAGQYAEQAAASLKAKRYGEDTVARKKYEAGRLPDARIHLRAQRYAVKLFLSDYQHVAYELHFQQPPPKPYVIAILGHAHIHRPPNWQGCLCDWSMTRWKDKPPLIR